MSANQREKRESRTRRNSFQKMLDLEKRLQLQRLRPSEPSGQTPEPPSLQSPAPQRGRESQPSKQSGLKPKVVRRIGALPPLSITIPSSQGAEGQPKSGKQQAGFSEGNATDRARENGEIAVESDRDSDHSSICQSPSWEGYGEKKKKKKHEAEQRRREKEQASKDAKVTRKKLAKPPPTGAVSPVEMKDNSVSASSATSFELQHPALRETAQPRPKTQQNPGGRARSSDPLPASGATRDGKKKADSGFIGGVKLRREKEAVASTVAGRPASAEITPLGNTALGQGADKIRSAFLPKSMSATSLVSPKVGAATAHTTKGPYPPTASKSYTVLNTTAKGHSRSRSRSSSIVSKVQEAAKLFKGRESRAESRSSMDYQSSKESSRADAEPAAEVRGRQSGSYVNRQRQQSTERAFAGLVDEYLVSHLPMFTRRRSRSQQPTSRSSTADAASDRPSTAVASTPSTERTQDSPSVEETDKSTPAFTLPSPVLLNGAFSMPDVSLQGNKTPTGEQGGEDSTKRPAAQRAAKSSSTLPLLSQGISTGGYSPSSLQPPRYPFARGFEASSSSSFLDSSLPASPVTTPDTSRPQSRQGPLAVAEAPAKTGGAGPQNRASGRTDCKDSSPYGVTLTDTRATGSGYHKELAEFSGRRAGSPDFDALSFVTTRSRLDELPNPEPAVSSPAPDRGRGGGGSASKAARMMDSATGESRQDRQAKYDRTPASAHQTRPEPTPRKHSGDVIDDSRAPVKKEELLDPRAARTRLRKVAPLQPTPPVISKTNPTPSKAVVATHPTSSSLQTTAIPANAVATSEPNPSLRIPPAVAVAVVAADVASTSVNATRPALSGMPLNYGFIGPGHVPVPGAARVAALAKKPASTAATTTNPDHQHHLHHPRQPFSAHHQSPRTGAGIVAAAEPEQAGQQPLAKMFVVCCQCHFFHDMPSRVYECMARPDAVVEDRTLGVSGAIVTAVRCPWCAHSMSITCCAGYAAVVHLKERLH